MPRITHLRAARFGAQGLLAVVAISATLSAQRGDDKAALMQRIDARRDHYAGVAKEIWGFAEVGYQEVQSSALLQQELKAAGFQVRAGVYKTRLADRKPALDYRK
jgi:aminobenzoyl-glutamate utilization protein B